MSQVQERYTVCDGCGGAIPDGVDRVTVGGTIITISGNPTSYNELDFCCTDHVAAFLQKQPYVAAPAPPYPPPPGV